MKTAWTVPLIAALVFIADAATKAWALAHLQEGTTTAFIPGILNLTLTTNTGGAFGIGHQFKELMTALPVAVCIAILYWIIKRERRGIPLLIVEQIGLALVLGGALGNICDRLLRGRVTDFLDFAFMSFPIFNVADAMIDAGVALVVIHTLLAAPAEQPQTPRGEKNG